MVSKKKKTSRLVLILGDQLTPEIASLRSADPSTDVVIMGEIVEEATYVQHHKKKLIFVFSAMRHFAEDLREAGWSVDYAALDGAKTYTSFKELVADAVDRYAPETLTVVEPGEWRLFEAMKHWDEELDCAVEILDDERFLCSHDEFADWAEGRKSLRMEYFYREMRKKTGLLIEDGAPEGGKWNYDQENRKPPKDGLKSPAPPRFEPDAITRNVIDLVEDRFGDHFGDAAPFWFAVTRKDAEKARDRFLTKALAQFGDYQDAMMADNRFLFHSLLSMYINAGLLDPLDVCRRAVKQYEKGAAPLNAVEGFIRQIIGWREFVRGIYWREGPDYVKANFFKADRKLPDFYWTGETDMACLRAAIAQTKEEAYAHHIQRLMVTGTFALIAGIDPHDVHEWYLAVYPDAYEWVEAPNVIGMALFADGGVLGSKPYAASGAYINRMSNYCGDCRYSVSKKTEDGACPFNALYWDFLIRNEDKLRGNGRLSRVYQNWARLDKDKKSAYRKRARSILNKLDKGAATDL